LGGYCQSEVVEGEGEGEGEGERDLFRFTLKKGVLCGREGRREGRKKIQEKGGGRVRAGAAWCNHSLHRAFLRTLTPYHISCVAPAFTRAIGGQANTTA
jgi:hypothetical protein